MSPLTIAWTTTGAICLTLALVYGVVWFQQRRSLGHLFFSLAALGAGANAYFELALMKSQTIPEWAFWSKLAHLALFVLLPSLAWFVVAHFGTARRSLAWAVTLGWGFYGLGSLFTPYTLIYSDVTSLRSVPLPWGESFSLPVGEPHALKWSADLVSVVLLVFFADATWSLWKRGDRGKALGTGGSLMLFLVVAGIYTPLVDVGAFEAPPLISFTFLVVVLAMATELTRDVVRAGRLSEEIKSNERRWRTLTDHVHLVVVGLDASRRINYVNPFACELAGYTAEELIGRDFRELSPGNLESGPRQAFDTRHDHDDPPFSEARLRTREGEERIVIFASVRLSDERGAITGVVSVGRDITEQRRAEGARDRALEETRVALKEVEALKARLEEEVVQLRSERLSVTGFDEIVGKSDPLLYVLRRVEQVAPLETTVLIEGETGVGKELVARAIHEKSPRSSRPLITVNCAALPPNLIESELFGHEKGAFTGADRMRRGRFELADGGTVFLDEVGELPAELQGKLLRVIQEGEVERIGGGGTVEVDVRLIAATNRRLEDEVQKGHFREDLFYRLNVFPLTIPPLRQRREDIPLLVETFVKRHASAQGKAISSVPKPVMDELIAHEWQGNVRELSNVIEQAVVTSSDGPLKLPSRLTDRGRESRGNANPASRGTLDDVERDYILEVLGGCEWRIEGERGAARRLGLHPNTLRNRMRKLGIQRPTAAPS